MCGSSQLIAFSTPAPNPAIFSALMPNTLSALKRLTVSALNCSEKR